MPAFVKSRFGESGMRLDEGTMMCCFDLKKSRNDWRIWALVIISFGQLSVVSGSLSANDSSGPLTTDNKQLTRIPESEPGNLVNAPRQGEWKFADATLGLPERSGKSRSKYTTSSQRPNLNPTCLKWPTFSNPNRACRRMLASF